MRLSVDETFQKYGDRVFSAAFSVCRNRADADDVTQDVFLKYHTTDMDYESEEHIRAWLIRVAINRAKDIAGSFWRRNKVAWEEYMDDLPFETPEDKGLFEAVMRLPDKYRVVIHLFYYEDYSVEEIAQILKSPTGTVKSQLSRGRMLLKNMLEEEWNDDE
ncbi:MAG: sigma-70 family RNA polymerase sigma factor [Ruminococcaceae bacterium]|jgi:RNA polymerase sigma-70 factor (ECF subfamily)|nr:sigma-70 family RNA polymerase sigma factor [Oscillospiraceae bacterium]